MKKYHEYKPEYGSRTLDKIIQWVDETIAKNPGMTYKDFELSTTFDYDCSHPSIEYQAEETPAELAYRLQEEENARAWRRRQYEELKKEFE